MTRDYPDDGIAYHVATCQCGWTDRIHVGGHVWLDVAINSHWLDEIARNPEPAA